MLPLRQKKGQFPRTLRNPTTELPDSTRAQALLARVFGARAAGAWIDAPIDGAINRTFPVRLDDTRYALRLRVNEAGFRYEKGIAKSALVGAIHAAKRDGASDRAAAAAKPNGKAPPHAPSSTIGATATIYGRCPGRSPLGVRATRSVPLTPSPRRTR